MMKCAHVPGQRVQLRVRNVLREGVVRRRKGRRRGVVLDDHLRVQDVRVDPVVPLRVLRHLGLALRAERDRLPHDVRPRRCEQRERERESDHALTVAGAGRRRRRASRRPLLEERLRERPAGIGDHDLAAELRQELEQLRRRSAPRTGGRRRARAATEPRAASGSGSSQRTRFTRSLMLLRFAFARRSATASSAQSVASTFAPRSAAASDGRPSPAPSSSDAPVAHVERRDDLGERDAARPQLRPVRQKLVLVERVLVDELVGVRRPQQRHAPAGELERLLDQSAA